MSNTDNPHVWFLHRLDTPGGLGSYVRTTPTKLRNAAFIDGRAEFWDAEEIRPIDPEQPRISGDRLAPAFIFHVSFCGSTLLAQLLDQPGRTLVLREPQALADLASQQTQLTANGGGALSAIYDLAIREIETPTADGETLVVKPSNWANSLIPIMCDPEREARAVFVSMDRADFITAVFRGGRDRLAYTTRALAHLSGTTGLGKSALQEAAALSEDPLDQVANFAALSHRIQELIFRTAMTRRNWGEEHWIDIADIIRDPVTAAKSAAGALGLKNDAAAIEHHAARFAKSHSKNQAATFSGKQRGEENAAVLHHHGGRIERAADWAETVSL